MQGVDEYEPRVVHQLLDFMYGYVSGVLQDAEVSLPHTNLLTRRFRRSAWHHVLYDDETYVTACESFQPCRGAESTRWWLHTPQCSSILWCSTPLCLLTEHVHVVAG